MATRVQRIIFFFSDYYGSLCYLLSPLEAFKQKHSESVSSHRIQNQNKKTSKNHKLLCTQKLIENLE